VSQTEARLKSKTLSRTRSHRKNPRHFDGTRGTSHHLQELLPQVLDAAQRRVAQRPDLILVAWSRLIGPSFEGMTEALSFEEGVLTVRVKNATLYSLLQQYERARLLSRLRQECPHTEIKNILFRVG
jgi:hypothetical protein